MDSESKAERRREQIRLLILSNTVVSLGEFCDRLQCSESTIRNDLKFLEEKGLITRTYGGAAINESTKHNIPMNTRSKMNIEGKRQIAKYIVGNLIAENSTVMLDSGTTNVEIAKVILESSKELTVITTSLAIADVLSKTDSINLFLAGGRLHQIKDAFIDHSACEFIASMRADLYILSCDGVSADAGFTIADPEEAYVKSLMSRSSKRTICALDSTKLDAIYMKVICRLDAVDMLITDKEAKASQIKSLRGSGLNVISAEAGG
jgi:DeoR/GlpR family transcriptional regulator of sugar metabolism